jgi:hypothetical protein
VPGKSIRHFTGYCPVAKWAVAEARNRAIAAAASLLLDKLQADMPFSAEGIQVDGGSEFMAEFRDRVREAENQALRAAAALAQAQRRRRALQRSLALRVLRLHRTTGSVAELNPLIDQWRETYNFVRPHGALSGLTPAQYLLRRQAKGDSTFPDVLNANKLLRFIVGSLGSAPCGNIATAYGGRRGCSHVPCLRYRNGSMPLVYSPLFGRRR